MPVPQAKPFSVNCRYSGWLPPSPPALPGRSSLGWRFGLGHVGRSTMQRQPAGESVVPAVATSTGLPSGRSYWLRQAWRSSSRLLQAARGNADAAVWQAVNALVVSEAVHFRQVRADPSGSPRTACPSTASSRPLAVNDVQPAHFQHFPCNDLVDHCLRSAVLRPKKAQTDRGRCWRAGWLPVTSSGCSGSRMVTQVPRGRACYPAGSCPVISSTALADHQSQSGATVTPGGRGVGSG